MRRAYQKRDAMLSTRPWPGALLATQRLARDAAAREVNNKGLVVRHTLVCRFRWLERAWTKTQGLEQGVYG
jgi:hypothetical protein